MPKAGPKRYQAKDYVNLFKLGYSYKQIAAKLDVEYDAVKSAMYRWRKKSINEVHVPYIIKRYEDQPAETERWTNTLNRLSKRNRFLRVAHINDLHFPFFDEDAFNMTLEILAQFRPHLTVVGSDCMDNPTASKWERNRDILIDDFIGEMEYHYPMMIDRIRVSCDETELAYIAGNHDQWAMRYIRETESPKTLFNEYIRIARQKGQVMWLGATDRVRVGSLTVVHGEFATVHTAKKLLDDSSGQENIMCGHTHRPDFYTVKGILGSVKAAVSGCNCSLSPHYQYAKKATKWQHGTVLATVDMSKGVHPYNAVHFDNLVYNHEHDHLWTVAQGQVMQVKKQQAMEKVA